MDAEPEVDQLHLLVSIDQDVLCLDIPVHDVPLMHVPQCLCDHVQEFLGLIFFQSVFVLR